MQGDSRFAGYIILHSRLVFTLRRFTQKIPLQDKELYLAYYKRLFSEKYGARLSVILRKRGGYTDSDGFFRRMTELIRSELPEIPLSFDLEHEDNNYYKGINFKLYMEKDNEKIEIGDGGFVDWIAKLISNKKARCLISGVGMDRMLLL